LTSRITYRGVNLNFINVCKPLRNNFLRGFLLIILFFSLCVESCAKPQGKNAFYQGLSEANPVPYFEKALSDPNQYIRSAAADRLAGLMHFGTALSSKTAERVRREASGAWASAFDVVGKKDKERALAFLFNLEQNTLNPIDSGLYVLHEFEKQGKAFSEIETAAIDGHFDVLRIDYNEALESFRKITEGDNWPEKTPQLFLTYPVLINDLGKAFQYTSSGKDGLNLFLQWEEKLEKSSNEDDLRYRLLFFAARIARRRGLNEQAVSLFERSRQLAPAGEQLDACIWYILDISVGGSFDVFIKRLEQLIPYWQKDIYFDDILEKHLQTLVSKKEWEKIIRVYDIIKTSGTASSSGYAWVIARAIEEGYLSENEKCLAATVSKEEKADYVVFYRKAYDAGKNYDPMSLYYRSLSASALDLPLLDLPPVQKTTTRKTGQQRKSPQQAAANKKTSPQNSPALQFLLGFFSNDASAYALKYIKALEKDLTADELRAVAQALVKADMYADSIRLVSGYVNKNGYVFNKEDLELLFPRPYKELTEKYAADHELAPALMFGLIRTESAFESAVVSRAGATGLTQIMPKTAEEMANRIRRAGGPNFINEDKSIDLKNPELNIHMGSFYLKYLSGRFDDMLVSLMAYNAGANRVRRLRAASKMPSDLFLETVSIYETRNYGRRVLSAAAVYKELYYR